MVFDDNCGEVVALMLISPAPGAVLDNGCTSFQDLIEWEFDWSDVPNVERYHLYVIGSTATAPVINDMWLTESEYRSAERAYIADFNRMGWSWKVRAMTGGEWGEWTDPRFFDVEPVNTDCS